MHPIVLGTAGYTLILTSLVSLVILLRKSVKRCIGSSLHALTMSDILSSVVTGILLILNQYSQPIAGPFAPGGANRTTDDLGWIKFVDGDGEEPRVFLGSLGIPDGNGTRAEDAYTSCDFNSTVMQYAMFIFPFANAFVSLLSFSARASVDIDQVSSRCRRIIGTGSTPSGTGSDDSTAEEKDCTRKKNEIKIAGLGVIGQWIVPVMLAAVVQLAGQQRTDYPRASSDMECVYGINFPFDNCQSSETTKFGIDTKRVEHTTPSANDYIASVDSTRMSGDNSSREIDEVISKVNAIVGSVMNSTGSEATWTRAPSHYELSDLENITRIMESMSSDDEDGSEASVYVTDSSEDNSEYSDDEGPTTQIEELDPAEEMKLFESLMNRTEDSSEFFQEETESNAAEVEPVKVNDYSEASINGNVTTGTEREKTDNEIYADIVKKIHAVVPQLRPREKDKPVRENDRSRSKKNSFAYEKHREDMPECANSGCFVSTKFLKIHLLVILFVVYFLPIFISALLQTRARYACLSVKEKIESSVGREDLDGKKSEVGVKSDRAGPSGWFPAVLTNEHEISASSSEDLVRASNFREINYSVSVTPEERRIVDSEALRSMEEETMESERISELFGTALLLAVLLWTPIFLQILAKVFLCVEPGEWLMNSSFFGASLFGVARNILDLRMIRTREIIRNDGKMNTICPGS